MRFLKFPTMVGWSVTQACDLRCVYCSQAAGEPLPNELTTQEALQVVDQVAKHQASVIGFTGGEPFLRPDLEVLVTRAAQYGLRCVVTTNSNRIETAEPSFLVKFIKIRISLDGPDPASHEAARRGRPGGFDTVVAAIRKVSLLGIKVEVVTTVGRHNSDRLEEMHEFLQRLGVPEWSASFLMAAGRGAEHAALCFTPEEYRDVVIRLAAMKESSRLHLKTDIPQNTLLKAELQHSDSDHFCSAATDLMVIFPNGSVGPCFTLPVTDGNVRSHDLYDIWNNSPLFQSFRDKTLLEGNCKGCEFVQKCGGCRAHAYAATGQAMMGDPLCWHRSLPDHLPTSSSPLVSLGTGRR